MGGAYRVRALGGWGVQGESPGCCRAYRVRALGGWDVQGESPGWVGRTG